MRLMQAMAGATHGGAESFFVRLAVALETVDDLTQQLVMRRDAARAEMLGQHGVTPRQLPFGGLLDLWTPMAFRREVTSFKPDILLTWMNRASRIAPRGRHVVIGRLGGYYDLKYYRRCDHLICNTPDLVRHVRAGGWPDTQSTYLPNFVALGHSEASLRPGLEVPQDALLLLGLGRLHHNKAFDVLLSALAQLPAARLVLAGSGPEEASLRRLAGTLGVADRVRFVGWVDDVGGLLRACDIFVCSSRVEPLGNVVLEAWAAERPVVAAASEGPRQLIRHEHTGLLVPIDDADAMAAAIKRLRDDPGMRAALAGGGHAIYERDFSEAVVVRRYMDFFEKVRP